MKLGFRFIACMQNLPAWKDLENENQTSATQA